MNSKKTSLDKDAAEYFKILKDDDSLSRQSILDKFMNENYLAYINMYFICAEDFIQHILLKKQQFNDLNKYPYECLIFSQTLRIRRYVKGLHHLSAMKQQGIMTNCTDSYFPILKSLFELFVENRLTNAYINDFGKSDSNKKDIVNRVLDYSDIDRKKNNYKFNYIKSPIDLPPELMAEDIQEYNTKSRKQKIKELEEVAKRLGYNKFTEVRHWYPRKDKKSTLIIKKNRRDFGSMRWRCQDVLGEYLPTEKERNYWKISYDTLYEFLNRYSHPALGYDDNFRPNQERMFDLFQVACQIIIALESYILPSIIKELNFQVKLNKKAKDKYKEMEDLKNIFLPFYMFGSAVVNMESYKNK